MDAHQRVTVAEHSAAADAVPWTRPSTPAWLDPWLRWLDAALHRDILRVRARYELSMDELRGLYVSDEQVDRLVVRRAEDPEVAARIDSVEADLDALLATARLGASPLSHVATRFRLTEVEVLALVL